MRRIYQFFIAAIFLSTAVSCAKGQQKINIYPKAEGLKVYVFDSDLKFIKNVTVDAANDITVDPNEFSKNKYFVVVTSNSNYYYIGTSQQVTGEKKIQLQSAAPMPWIKIADGTKLITSQNQYINIHAHGGLTYSLDKDLMSIIRLKLLGFNGFRLVFRSFDSSSNEQPGLYLKTAGPFNQTISGFTDTYVNEYIVPKIQLAKLLGMYVILDHHDMFIHDKNVMNEYETNANEYNAWLDMWKHLSAKFKDEPAVAIYEVQNEPGSKMSQDFVLKMHNDVIKLIRQNDTNHLIAFGHSWGNINQQFYLDKGIPVDPDKKLIYTMHHYYTMSQPFDGGLTKKITMAVQIGQKYKVPIWFGESDYKNNYSQASIDMLEKWYDFADKNFISTSIWREDDILGTNPKNGVNQNYLDALNVKKRVFLSQSNDWNIRCSRKDYTNGSNYTITNPDAGAAHIQINYPMFNTVTLSPDNPNVKITNELGHTTIDGTFKTIAVTLK